MQQYRLWRVWLESCLAKKDLGVLANIWIWAGNMSGWSRCPVASWPAPEIGWLAGLWKWLSLCTQHHTSSTVFGWAHRYKKSTELLRRVQRATKLVKGWENKTWGQQLREPGLFSVEKRRLRGDVITLCNYLKGGCSKEGVSLFSQVTGDRTWGDRIKFCQRKFRLAVRKCSVTGRVVRYWNRLLKKVVKSPSLEVFKRYVDVALRDMVDQWICSVRRIVGLDDLRGLFKPKQFYGSIISSPRDFSIFK